MALPIPDRSKVYFRESNVSPNTGHGVKCAFDLVLYRELGTTDRGVLEVSVTMQYQFEDGKTATGEKLIWTEDEKKKYAKEFAQAIYDVWDNKHRIKSTNNNAELKDIGVVFEIYHYIDGWTTDEHWELTVIKFQPTPTEDMRVSAIDWVNNEGEMDSGDVNPVNKGANTGQRAAAHEFGHCLGLNDEYDIAGGNPNWKGDKNSVMHSGEVVRERHYAQFADWMTRQFEHNDVNRRLRSLGYEPIAYKVNGTTDLFNARL
jgi:hypothetical protein